MRRRYLTRRVSHLSGTGRGRPADHRDRDHPAREAANVVAARAAAEKESDRAHA
jgi:hypothetical protein